MLDYESLLRWSENQWEKSILPSLSDFISIEALSPGFEPKWEEKESSHKHWIFSRIGLKSKE